MYQVPREGQYWPNHLQSSLHLHFIYNAATPEAYLLNYSQSKHRYLQKAIQLGLGQSQSRCCASSSIPDFSGARTSWWAHITYHFPPCSNQLQAAQRMLFPPLTGDRPVADVSNLTGGLTNCLIHSKCGLSGPQGSQSDSYYYWAGSATNYWIWSYYVPAGTGGTTHGELPNRRKQPYLTNSIGGHLWAWSLISDSIRNPGCHHFRQVCLYYAPCRQVSVVVLHIPLFKACIKNLISINGWVCTPTVECADKLFINQ